MHLSLALNLLPEVAAERAGRVKIHGATDHLREFLLESGESEARNVTGLEFNALRTRRVGGDESSQ
jgi:hypothetical protein